MWAHYAGDFAGIVIECDGAKVLKAFPEARIENVKYSRTPITINADQVLYAYTTTKPRHTHQLKRAAFNAAYFTKSKYWSYERELRFVTGTDNVTTQSGVMTVTFPIKCVNAIIIGPEINPRIARQIFKFGAKTGLNCYRMHIARSSMRSFFSDPKGQSFLFNGKKLIEADNTCCSCNEPLEFDAEKKCHWWAVSKAHEENAAFRNPMRQLAHLGLLEDYLKRVSKIE